MTEWTEWVPAVWPRSRLEFGPKISNTTAKTSGCLPKFLPEGKSKNTTTTLQSDVISFCINLNKSQKKKKEALPTGWNSDSRKAQLPPSPFPCLSLKIPSFWIHFNEQLIETASRGSKQSRDSHFDLFPMEKRAPCLACKMFTWLTFALMCKLLWTSDI